MKFAAYLNGVTPKDKSTGKVIEVKLSATFDAGLFAELGNSFGDRVSVAINDPQIQIDFGEEEKN